MKDLVQVHLLGISSIHQISHVIDHGRHDVLVLVVVSELSLVFVLVIHVLKGGETKVNQFDCLVNVLLLNKVSELELSHRLRNSDDGK